MSTSERAPRIPWTAAWRRRDRRRGYRIDPVFQSRFRVRMLAFSVGILLMTAILARGVVFAVENPAALPVSPWVPGSLLVLVLAIGGAIFHLSDRLSHRYCGPVHRITRTLEAVQRGERPRPIRLRKGDEFQDLAATLNDTLRGLGALDETS